jgi:aspartyl-tRNA synthetase
MHHPFTAPMDEDMALLDTDRAACRAKAYDIVINGYEAGGGSIRIHDRALQRKIFEVLKLSDEDIKTRFGFFIEAFSYGAPPHGGLAFGLDRLCMLLLGTDDIRQVIAFPKNQSAQDVMSDAPTVVTEKQLEELSVAVDIKE